MATLTDSKSSLDRMFSPRAVAVIGASASARKFGTIITDMLHRHGYAGGIYPINPSLSAVRGLPAFPSLAEAPADVDVAVICLPADGVVDAFRQCIEKGVVGAVVISSGLGETHVGSALQSELVDLSSASGVRVIGPNCEGFVNYECNLVLTFSAMFDDAPRRGPISYVSQSGAYAGILYRRVSDNGFGFSKVVSSGNEADVNATELMEYFGQDPSTSVVAAYLEQIRQPRRFFSKMSLLARQKPVVVNKVGWSPVGQQAARSHTGALAAADRVVDAVLRQSGVVRARHMDEFVDMTLGLASQPASRGNRVAILSAAGGLGVEMADQLTSYGFAIPPLEAATVRALSRIVPYYGSADNPVDLTSTLLQNSAWPADCIRLAAADRGVDSVVLTLTAMRDMRAAELVCAAIRESRKPVVVCWTAGEIGGDALRYLPANGIPIFPSPLRAVAALRALSARGRFLLGDEFTVAESRP